MTASLWPRAAIIERHEEPISKVLDPLKDGCSATEQALTRLTEKVG